MKTNIIDKLVKRVLKESLQEKADDLVSKIKSNVSEDMTNDETCKYHMDNFGPDDDRTKKFCKSEMDEEMEEGNAFTGALAKAKESGDDSFEVGGKKFSVEEDMDEEMCSECGGMMYEGECSECGSKWMGEEMDEEMEEGNAFTGALAKAKESGDDSFEVDGKRFSVKEAKGKKCPKCGMIDCKCNHKKENKEGDEKFIQKATKKMEKKGTEGSFTEYCGGEVTKSCIDKAMKSGDAKLIKKANFAKNIKGYKGAEHKKKSVKESVQLTEEELISLIESIVLEDKKAKGMAETEKVLGTDKKTNEKAIADVTKKMKEYLKGGSNGEYETNPEQFPLGNGQIKKMKTMKYNPSEAVEEYIEAYSMPGQTNLVFDEIKPDEKKIEKYLKGDSTTGNAVKDKDGKALGNVVPSKVGDRFKKNYDENLYGQEQMNASYKRYPQDTIDVAGDVTKKGGLKKGKKTAQSVLDKVDESNNKEGVVLNEEFNKMKHLMGYNKKTQ